MALAAGDRLGPYEIVGLVGAGGMGEVYRARDPRLHREVAVKVLPERLSRDPQALARFAREAKTVAAISHPNILGIYDVGSEGGTTYIVTELLEGETLRTRLRNGVVGWREAVEIGAAVAEGLSAAHRKGNDLGPPRFCAGDRGSDDDCDPGTATASSGGNCQTHPAGTGPHHFPVPRKKRGPAQSIGPRRAVRADGSAERPRARGTASTVPVSPRPGSFDRGAAGRRAPAGGRSAGHPRKSFSRVDRRAAVRQCEREPGSGIPRRRDDGKPDQHAVPGSESRGDVAQLGFPVQRPGNGCPGRWTVAQGTGGSDGHSGAAG